MSEGEGRGALVRPPPSLAALRQFCDARIALGRAGSGLPTAAHLRFTLDHARARDAVWSALEGDRLAAALAARGLPTARLASRAGDRATYIRRPDLGRQVDLRDGAALAGLLPGRDVLLALVDGLSATAVNLNALPLLDALLPLLREQAMTLAGAVLIEQGRVAAPDAVAANLQAGCTITLVGERPGLSAADSLGTYLTWQAVPGTPDSRRNCVSNLRDGGLAPAVAARRIAWLAAQMRQRRISGVFLKEASEATELPGPAQALPPTDRGHRP